MSELTLMHTSPDTASTPGVPDREISRLMAELPGWEIHVIKGVPRLEKSYQFKDFNQALAFTNLVGQLANQEDHHPDILTEWGKVTVTWWTHRIKGLSMNDFIMAAKTESLL